MMVNREAPMVCANCKWWEDDTHEGMGKCHYQPIEVRKGIEDWCAHFAIISPTREPQYDLNYPPYQMNYPPHLIKRRNGDTNEN